jgi:hypothetical protein
MWGSNAYHPCAAFAFALAFAFAAALAFALAPEVSP